MGQILSNCRADFPWAFAAAVVVYGAFVFVPGFHIDDELSAAYGTIASNISIGRWGTSLIRTILLPGPFNGYFASLLSIAVLSLCAVLFPSLLGMGAVERRLTALLFVAFPQFCYELEFHVQAEVIPAGYALAIVSFALLRVAHQRTSAVQAGLLAGCLLLQVLALAIYQPIILIFVSLCLLRTLQRSLQGAAAKELILFAVTCGGMVVLSCAVYFLSSRLVLHATGIPSGGSYFTDQFAWNKQPIAIVTASVLRLALGASDGLSYYGESLYAYTLIPAVIVCGLSLRLGAARCAFSIAMLLLLLVSPYCLVIALGSMQAGRTFVSQAVVFAGLWAMALRLLSVHLGASAHRAAAFVIAGGFVLSGSFMASRLAFVDYIQWKADVSTATRLVGDIYHRYSGFDEQRHPVFFYGAYKRPNFWRRPNYNLFGASFFEWDGGNTDRIDAFMTVSAIADFHAPPADQRPSLAMASRTLPVWPDPGAIAMRSGTLIVRLGP